MDENTRLEELSDQELAHVAGGLGYGGPALLLVGGDLIGQKNLASTKQQANAHGGIAAVAFNVATTTPINVNVKIGG